MNTRSFNYAFALLILLLFSYENITSQEAAKPPKIVPPTPNAAALGEYGKVPVGLFTGTIEQDIPLYEITASGYSLPISLNYRSNGIKVSDIGSNVGIGWTLNAGGVITRTLNDEPDEYGSTRVTVPQVGFDTPEMRNFLMGATQDNNWDGEPDIFSFNFGKYAGKFYLTGTPPAMQAVLVSPSPLKIEFLSDFYSENVNTVQIKITDPEGVIYWFGGTNAIEKGYSRTYNSGNTSEASNSKRIRNTWYLTKIILLNAEEINFLYDKSGGPVGGTEEVVYEAGISQTVSSTVTKVNAGEIYTPAWHSYPMVTSIFSSGFKLNEINWRNGKITLNYSLRFTGGNTDLEKLDWIRIYTKNNTTFTLLKQYSLNYLVTAANPTYNSNFNGSFLENSNRLFLQDLITFSPGDLELNRYTFEYYDPTNLPSRFSYSLDYWGYFNGQINTDLVSDDISQYNPDYYQAPFTFTKEGIAQTFSGIGGVKDPNAQYALKGMLKKITYPTGGYSNLEYELHSSGGNEYNKQTVNLNVFGTPSFTTSIIPFNQNDVQLVPFMKIDDVNSCPQGVRTINYTLTVKEVQSGANVPIRESNRTTAISTPFTVPFNTTKNYYVNFQAGKSYTITIDATSPCQLFTAKLSFSYSNNTTGWVNKPIGGMRISKVTTGDLTGNEQVKRYYYGSDLNSLTKSTGKARSVEPAITYFESLALAGDGTNESTLKVNFSSSPLHDIYNSQGYHISYSNVIESNGNNFEGGAVVYGFNTVPETSPVVYRDPVLGTPFNNVFGNGEETKTNFYKNVGVFVKVKEINRSYTTDSRLVNSVPGFRASKRFTSYINSTESYNLSTYFINSQWRYLYSSAETTYDQSGGNGSTQTTNYEYASQVHMQPTAIADIFEDAGSTNQRMLYKRYYFPTDFTFPGTLSGTAAVIKTMVDKHIFNIPIEQLNFSVMGSSNLNLIGGNLTTYKMNGSKVVKDKDYTLKSANSTIYQDLTWVAYANINASGQFVFDSHYEPLNSYNRYDTVNNILEVADRKSTSSLIREPVSGNVWAKVANGNYTGTAYSSFEHSTASAFTNWNYNLAGIVSLTDAQNGAKAFTLSATNLINSAQTLSSTQKYKVSFWRKTSAGTTFSVKANGVTVTLRTGPERKGWRYYEGTFTGATTLQITGNATIDELRLYPQSSRMISYVYKDGVGPISQCDENNQNTFWEYDDFNRLKLTRDQDGNILQKNEYKYQHIQPN